MDFFETKTPSRPSFRELWSLLSNITAEEMPASRGWNVRVVVGPCRTGEALGVWSDRNRLALTCLPPGVPIVTEDDQVSRSGWRCASWTYQRSHVGLTPLGAPLRTEQLEPDVVAAMLERVGPGATSWFLRRLSDQIAALHSMVQGGDQRLASERDDLVELHARLARAAHEQLGKTKRTGERRRLQTKVTRERRRRTTGIGS